jgi:His-Xaa-Ser system protein HxsD
MVGPPREGAMSSAAGASSAEGEATGAGAIDAAKVSLVFDRATVDLDALQRSVYAMAAEVTVDIRVSGDDYVCTLFPRKRETIDDELKHRFRAEVNDQILRVRIAKETEPLRNLVFALAFSQTGLADAEGTA